MGRKSPPLPVIITEAFPRLLWQRQTWYQIILFSTSTSTTTFNLIDTWLFCCALHARQSNGPDHREKKDRKHFSWLIKTFDYSFNFFVYSNQDWLSLTLNIGDPDMTNERTRKDTRGKRRSTAQGSSTTPPTLGSTSDTQGKDGIDTVDSVRLPCSPSHCSESPSPRLTPLSVRSSSIPHHLTGFDCFLLKKTLSFLGQADDSPSRASFTLFTSPVCAATQWLTTTCLSRTTPPLLRFDGVKQRSRSQASACDRGDEKPWCQAYIIYTLRCGSGLRSPGAAPELCHGHRQDIGGW